MLLQGGEAVGDGAETRTLDIRGVVTGTTAVVVAALFDAVVNIEAKEGGRRVEREHALDVVVDAQFQVHEVHHLAVPGVVQLFEGFELSRVARF